MKAPKLLSPFIISILAVVLISCTPSPENYSPTQTGEISPSSTPTPVILDSSAQTTPVAPDQVISPLLIQKGDYIFEITSYSISSQNFDISVQIKGLYQAQIPQLLPNHTFAPISELNLLFGERGDVLELIPIGGRGGSQPNEDGTLTLTETYFYKLRTPLPAGQTHSLIILISLHEVFEIHEPLRFILEVSQLQ